MHGGEICLVNPRFGRFGTVAVEEAEVAAFVGLGDFVFEELAVTTGVAFFGRGPGGASGREFFVADVKGEGAIGDIEFDEIAILHEGEGAADGGFGRNVEDAGSVGSAGHAGIGDAEDVADSFFEEVFWNGKHAGFGDAGGANWAGILHDENVFRSDTEGGIVDAFLDVGVVFEDDGGSFVLQEFGSGRRGFDDGTVGGEVSPKNGGAALLGDRIVEGADDFVVVDFGAVKAFAEGLTEDGGGVEVEEVTNAVEESGEATDIEEVGHDVFAGWSEVGEDRGFSGDFVEEFEGKVDPCAFRHRGDVDDGVGRTTDRHVGGDGVFEGFAGEVAGGFEILPDHVHDAEATRGGHA